MRTLNKGLAGVTVLAAAWLAGSVGIAWASVPAPVSQGQSKFAALRHAPTSAPPAEVAKFLASKTGLEGRVDVAQTRRIPAPGGGSWDVTPGEGVICLFVESEQTGGCASTADALAGRLNMQFVRPATDFGQVASVPVDTARFQAGLLPDDVLSATASSTLGRPVLARPNSDGLYRLAAASAIGTVTMHRFNKRSTPITVASKWKKGRPTLAKPTAKAASCPCSDWIPSGHSYWAFYAGGNYGTYAPIWYVAVAPDDGNTICGNTRNLDGTWAGNFFCTANPYGVFHTYNSSYRSGWAGPGYPSASVYGQALEQW